MTAPARVLRVRGRALELGGDRPVLMGIVNATPDSFSDAGEVPDLEARVARANELAAAGAAWLDVGGESAAGAVAPVDAGEEIARVVPVIEAVAASLPGVIISVDTHKVDVAGAAIAAGAHVVNDVSGLRDLAMASLCAETGAALIVMHTRAAPKQTLLDPGYYDDVVDDVVAFLRERMAAAVAAGVEEEQVLLDPGPDFTKTPAQTVAVMRSLPALHELGRPLLLPVSRKDFLGTITGRAPRDRDAGTLAALGFVADAGAHVVRVHDVGACADFLDVRDVLRGERSLGTHDGLASERYPPGTVVPGTWEPPATG